MLRTAVTLALFVSVASLLTRVSTRADPAVFSDDQLHAVPFTGAIEGKDGEGQLPERLALVIGINKYDTPELLRMSDLKNAENDATDVGQELSRARFLVTTLTVSHLKQFDPNGPNSISKNLIYKYLANLVNDAKLSREKTKRDPIVLVYFAGHGLNFDSKDYFLPSDFNPSFSEDIKVMGVSVEDVLERLSWAHPALRVVISDACRSLTPGILRSITGDVVKAQPGNSNISVLGQISDAPSAIDLLSKNDTFLLFATLRNGLAKDLGLAANNGKFASALLSVLKKVRIATKFDDTNEKNSTLSILAGELNKRMNNDNSSRQWSEINSAADNFVLLPTFAMYSMERDAWVGANKPLAAAAGVDDNTYSKIAYCNFVNFANITSRYSYFASAAQERIHKYKDGSNDCSVETLNNQADLPGFQKSPTSGWSESPERHGRLHRSGPTKFAQNSAVQNDADSNSQFRLTIGTLRQTLAPSLVSDLAGFDAGVAISDLAIASAATTIFAEISRDEPVGSLQAGDIVQVDRVISTKSDSSTGMLHIITAEQKSGYVDQKPIDQGRIAVRFKVSKIEGRFKVSADAEKLLRENLILDMNIIIDQDQKLSGYTDAQTLSTVLTEMLRGAPYPILPRVGFSETKDPEDKNSELTVVATMFPLNKDIRMRATLLSGNFVSTRQALDLDALVLGQSVRPKPSGCDEPLRAAKASGADVPTAYLHLSRLSQISTSEHIRQFLKQNWYGVPSADFVQSVPLHNEIRVCKPEQLSFAKKTAHLLAACGLGQFNAKVIDDCKTDPAAGVQEVWLRKDGASAETIVASAASSFLPGTELNIPATTYVSNDVILSPEPAIQTRTLFDLAQLKSNIFALVSSIKTPNDNCASFRPDNPVITLVDASIGMNENQASLLVNGVAGLWSCVPNPVPNSKVEWREQKVGGAFGLVIKIPEVKTWPGSPIKALVFEQRFTMRIPVEARILMESAFEIVAGEPVITADGTIADAIREGLGDFRSSFRANLNDALQQAFQKVTSSMPRELLGGSTNNSAVFKGGNGTLNLEIGGQAKLTDQVLSWSLTAGFASLVPNRSQ